MQTYLVLEGFFHLKHLDECISTLNDLGLDITQSKVYLAIAKAGKITVHEISKLSGVARPHVYHALEKLEEAGLVIRIISQPEQFMAIPVEECTSILLKRRNEKTRMLRAQTALLNERFSTLQDFDTADIKLQFMLIPKKDAVYKQANKMLMEVQESIDFLCLTRRMLSWLSHSLSTVVETLDRKVAFRVIMPRQGSGKDVGGPIEMLYNYSNCTLRIIPKEPKFGFSIWDGKKILMTTSPVDSSTPATTLWSNNRGLVDLCQEHFCCLWEKAEKV
jgi:sugar-specific transcriptional regulator TrmB